MTADLDALDALRAAADACCSGDDADTAYARAAYDALPALVAEARAGRRLAAVVADPGAALRAIGWPALYLAAIDHGAASLWDGGGCRARSGAWEWVGEVDCRGDGPAETRALAAITAIWGEPTHAVLARLLP